VNTHRLWGAPRFCVALGGIDLKRITVQRPAGTNTPAQRRFAPAKKGPFYPAGRVSKTGLFCMPLLFGAPTAAGFSTKTCRDGGKLRRLLFVLFA